MQIQTAEFTISAPRHEDCPKPVFPEYAFTGRSNVGKSSLINMLCGHKNLARISSTPGKTALINHFLINKSWYLVDLPGYGFAKTGRANRLLWKTMVTDYLLYRDNLLTLFVLVDVNVPPQKSDLSFMEFLANNSIPFVITFTKTDKLKKYGLSKNISNYKRTLMEAWEELPQIIITSAIEKTGQKEILNYVSETNKVFKKN
ncbi:MAG: YihA family ribosome biogenesis GTP-binding protein [Bacteroidia bacterium]|nr:YihA family ribosome biogenesis GTP-binding protein [Bacteroidia bacterium]